MAPTSYPSSPRTPEPIEPNFDPADEFRPPSPPRTPSDLLEGASASRPTAPGTPDTPECSSDSDSSSEEDTFSNASELFSEIGIPASFRPPRSIGDLPSPKSPPPKASFFEAQNRFRNFPIRKKSIFEGTDYRIPRYEKPLPPFLAPVSRVLKISGVQQSHIQKTVHRKETRKIRKVYNKTVNKPWTCDICKVFCCNKAVKDAHLNSRGHLRKTENDPQTCKICKFTAFSPEDFQRHINGKRHKKNIQYK